MSHTQNQYNDRLPVWGPYQMENFWKWNPKKDITGNGCHYWKWECCFQYHTGKLQIWVASTLAARGLEEPRNSQFFQVMCELQLRILLMEKLLCFPTPTYVTFMRIIMYELCFVSDHSHTYGEITVVSQLT